MKCTLTLDDDVWKKAEFCSRCGSCKTVHAEQIMGSATGMQCPSGTHYLFESYYPAGRAYAAVAMLRGQLAWSDRLVDAIYSCTTCGFCQYTCQRINQLRPTDIVRWMRSKAVEAGAGPLPAQRPILQNLKTYDNAWGSPRPHRVEWTKKLGFPVKDLSNGGGRAEVLLFPGCAYAFDPRSQDTLRHTARLLQAAGVDFGILGKSEKCCGFTAFNLGYTNVLETYGAENIKTFNRIGVKTIVTPCPGCRTAIGKIYSHLGTLNYRVLHTTEMLAELVVQGRLAPKHPVAKTVTYHDPCQLGRQARIFDEPRRILQAIPGLNLKEMNRTREYAFCCGGDSGVCAGKPDFAQATARRRIAEAEETDAELLATACPFCEQNLRDCLDQTTSRLGLADVAELLALSVFGESPVLIKESRDALRN